ncbi:unnamed protein product [Adineta ricciae]|uniref:Glycolipid transfer protein domain-containing protein n=1 Tax=Adineta ricciae TaxID=249248 RepID=A0A814KS28_ADIRI|nr:unnamed protein product [Adineta ricciae]
MTLLSNVTNTVKLFNVKAINKLIKLCHSGRDKTKNNTQTIQSFLANKETRKHQFSLIHHFADSVLMKFIRFLFASLTNTRSFSSRSIDRIVDYRATTCDLFHPTKTHSHGNNVLDQESVRVREFVIAFRELAKFFNHLNVVFSFVANDLHDKFDLLDGCVKHHPVPFETVQTTIEHERNRDDKSGTVAILRLLRALEFTYLFLERAIVSPTDSKSTKHVAWDVYKQTLHKRHNRAVQASIWLATATIPKRDALKEILLRGEVEPDTADRCFPLIGKVYRQIYRIYEQNQLLELVPL